MLLKRNLLENVIIVSCSGTLICILLHYVTNISLLSGIWFPIYILTLFLGSVTLSFKFIQQLLHLNKPLKYDLDGMREKYPYLGFLWDVLPVVPKSEVEECVEYDTNELSVISTVLERRLVSSWYVPYVSQEIGFPFACKQLLDQMIGTAFQICNKMETKDVYVDICAVLITHLKEYKKAMKRHEKCPESSIQSLYKKSHPVSNSEKKNPSVEHCTNIMRIILKELVPWELWDTPHSELLVRILSKKLDHYVENTLADPTWLNDKLLSILEGTNQDETEESKTENNTEIPPEQKPDQKPDISISEPEPIVETVPNTSANPTVTTNTTLPTQQPVNVELPILEEGKVDAVQQTMVSSAPVDIKSSPVLRQRRGRQRRDEVKIYDRIIEGSVKTWETDTDLQCISLGQDLLESLNGDEISLNRLWEQDPQESDAVSKDSKLWFGDEDFLELEREPSKKETKEHSSKNADAILKDIQTTVHHAKNKIGDLQVEHATVNDEAAGMMEGLLDFGIAGLKKGLRFTGLGDDNQESLAHREKNLEKTSPPEPKLKAEKEGIAIPLVQREDNGIAVPPLVKQQRVSSQDSVASQPRALREEFPPVQPLQPLTDSDSPEPEYEEAADLSTSIAKLRCLLQQRAHTSGSERDSDDIWWEGAEETRGRTQRPRTNRSGPSGPAGPVDVGALADEYDMSERQTSPPQNNMRLDRLFQRTVTGVFNSLKTAVGAEGDAAGRPPLAWTYVCSSADLGVGGAVAQLVGSRRALGRGRAPRPAAAAVPRPAPHAPALDLPLGDLEEWAAGCGAAWSGGAELSAAAGLPRAHLALRLATLLFADIAESVLEVWLRGAAGWLRRQIFAAFARYRDTAPPTQPRRDFCREHTTNAILERIPAPVLLVFGEEEVREAVTVAVNSASHRSLNHDVALRLLDVLAAHFKNSAQMRELSFDSN